MVVASLKATRGDRFRAHGIPAIDLSSSRALVSDAIVRACEEFGFFTVINHGVSDRVIARMEAKASEFFSLPAPEKQRAGPASPLGYGSRVIGCNGDTGEVEYLLLPTNPTSISQRGRTLSKKDPTKFSCVVNDYVEAVRELACEILELLGGGLGLGDSRVFGRLLRDRESDSLLRLNHYPPCNSREDCRASKDVREAKSRVGFGEHTDPQILTLLRSNDVAGLQILPHPDDDDDGAWAPVPPDPTAYCVMVGDVLQAMTNGRLVSVRHRAMVNSHSSRLSMVYFGAPPLSTWISPLPEMIAPQSPRRYKSFTWGDYKKAVYSLRLGQSRLELFRTEVEEEKENGAILMKI